MSKSLYKSSLNCYTNISDTEYCLKYIWYTVLTFRDLTPIFFMSQYYLQRLEFKSLAFYIIIA